MEIKKKLMRTYNKIIVHYGGYRRKPWPEIREFISKPKPKQVILDIGAGTCSITAPLALKAGHKLVALDFSFEALKKCPAKILKICADAAALPLKSKTFKIALAISLLHHLPTPKSRLKVLKELKRVLKQRGTAFMSVWAKEQPQFVNKKVDVYIPWGLYKRYYHLFTRGKLKKLVGKVFDKFKIVSGKNHFVYLRK